MNDSTKTVIKKEKFTQEQGHILEVTCQVISDDLDKARSLVNITRESLMDGSGEFNKNITSYDVDCALQTILDLLDPICLEVSDCAGNAGYFLWEQTDKNQNSITNKIAKILKEKSDIV